MNVEHLKALVEDLLGDESQLKLQQHLEKFHKTIPTFVGQPQQPERQIEVAKALTILEKNVDDFIRSEEHTSELQSLMRISYAVFCLKTKNYTHHQPNTHHK